MSLAHHEDSSAVYRHPEVHLRLLLICLLLDRKLNGGAQIRLLLAQVLRDGSFHALKTRLAFVLASEVSD